MLKFIESGNIDLLRYASEELKKDRDFVLEAVKQNGVALIYASKELRFDKELIRIALEQSVLAIDAFSEEELLENRFIIITAVDMYPDYFRDQLKNLETELDEQAKKVWIVIKEELDKKKKESSSKFKTIVPKEEVKTVNKENETLLPLDTEETIEEHEPIL